MSKAPVRVAVTGAAGQIGYSLLFRIASGEMLGKDQPVILQLLEIPDEKAQKALKGVMMELDDCAFPLLAGMEGHSDPAAAFKDAEVALLVGARPRGPGMERKDLLAANAQIFTAQGKALDKAANRSVKVLVVGNPANTNAYIAMKSAPSLPEGQFHRDAAARPQPRAVAARGQDRQAGRIDPEAGGLGQPFADDVPGHPLRDDRRPAGRADGRRRRLVSRDLSSRPSASAAPRSSRRAACRRPPRRRTQRSTTSTTGCSASNGELGHDGRSVGRRLRRSGRDHLRRALHLRQAAATSSSRALRSTSSRAARWTTR